MREKMFISFHYTRSASCPHPIVKSISDNQQLIHFHFRFEFQFHVEQSIRFDSIRFDSFDTNSVDSVVTVFIKLFQLDWIGLDSMPTITPLVILSHYGI